MKTYKARGLVLGRYWGGGVGAYESQKINGETREEVLKKAEEMLKDGSLDGGMGFESLKGAILEIEEIEKIELKGKDFFSRDFEVVFIGDLTDDEKIFLKNNL